MIPDDCKKLLGQLRDIERAQLNKKTVELLKEREDELREVEKAVVVASEALLALEKRREISSKPDASIAIERTVAVRTALAVDANAITGKQLYRNMKNAFEKLNAEMLKATTKSWEEYLALPSTEPKADPQQVADAKLQKSLAGVLSQLEQKQRLAGQLVKSPPANEEEFLELERVWSLIREMIQSLPPVSNSPQVRAFFVAINSGKGAELSLLTDEVLDWLRENEKVDGYRIFEK